MRSTMNSSTRKQFWCGWCVISVVLIPIVSTQKSDYQLSTIDELRTEFLNTQNRLWNDVMFLDGNSLTSDQDNEIELIRAYHDFGNTIEKAYPHDIDYGLKPLQNLWIWARLYADLRSIYAMYSNFRRFQNNQLNEGRLPSPKRAWIDLAEVILDDPRASIPAAMDRIKKMVIDEKMFENSLKEANSDLCNLHQSPQQLLYNLYNSVALTELKGYSMMQFSWMLLKMYNKGNFTQEAELMKQRFIERTRTTIAAVKKVMSSASKHLWNCDPNRHIKGDTYLEITQLLQGFVVNEVDMNSDSTCRENCAYYTYAKSYGCFKNQYCSRQRKCAGKIINCGYVDSDMWICPSQTGSDRRYEYIEYENGRVLGRKMNCPRGTTKVDSWWRWLFWHCSYCMCLCDEQGQYSDRYFNMRAVKSDVADNKVITGLRFVKVNRIIHLQIQQGVLMERGNIKADSLEWVSPESYYMSDSGVVNGRDYHTLTWEQRAIDLDDLVAEEGHVVTGVRFRKVGSHLNFEIRATPFNFTSGTLINPLQKSVWISNDNTDGAMSNPRKELKLRSPDVPTRSPSPSAPDSETDQYIQFTNTDLDRDAAQTTVPFIDSQRVEPQIPTPLSGAGIYHKGQSAFGGFIAPKLITYDFTPHLQIPDPDKFEPDEVDSN